MLLDAAPEGWRRDLFVVAAFTGMRSGELRALHWEDVDFDAKLIRVSRSLWKRTFKAPKSEAGVRRIPMAPIVYNTLWRRAFVPFVKKPSEQTLNSIAKGKVLLAARRKVPPRGGWYKWPAENSGQSFRTSTYQMELARKAEQAESNVVALPGAPPQKPSGLVFVGDRKPWGMFGTAAFHDAFARLQIKAGILNTDPTRQRNRFGHARRQAQVEFDARTLPVIHRIQATGVTSALEIARHLDLYGVPTFTGCRWSPGAVQDILQRDAGIEARYSFHSLRHFAASIFIEQGATVKRVQEIMGHSTSQITLDIYSHLFTSHDDDQKMLAAAEAAVFPAGHNTG